MKKWRCPGGYLWPRRQRVCVFGQIRWRWCVYAGRIVLKSMRDYWILRRGFLRMTCACSGCWKIFHTELGVTMRFGSYRTFALWSLFSLRCGLLPPWHFYLYPPYALSFTAAFLPAARHPEESTTKDPENWYGFLIQYAQRTLHSAFPTFLLFIFLFPFLAQQGSCACINAP